MMEYLLACSECLAHIFIAELLNIMNTSLQKTWLPNEWKMAEIILFLMDAEKGFDLDTIRPIAVSSDVLKLIETVVSNHLLERIYEIRA